MIGTNLKGHQPTHKSARTRLPITIHIMQNIRYALVKEHQSYNNIMLWAACCMASFGFIVREFTIPGYDKDSHLFL